MYTKCGGVSFNFELTAISVLGFVQLCQFRVQTKFQICTISVIDILETCQFRPKTNVC
ncbi:hypothetical protein Hanom_Chr10g00937591 [Helianthus anomalus]